LLRRRVDIVRMAIMKSFWGYWRRSVIGSNGFGNAGSTAEIRLALFRSSPSTPWLYYVGCFQPLSIAGIVVFIVLVTAYHNLGITPEQMSNVFWPISRWCIIQTELILSVTSLHFC
jgi:hypothetical protein